jgi:hypothetical protein
MSSLFASKVPLDWNAGMIHSTTPSPDLSPERGWIPDPTLAQALPRKQTDGDLGLVQPTAMFGCVVYGKAFPQPVSRLLAKAFDYRLAGMRVQIVQHQMDDVGLNGNLREIWSSSAAGAFAI